MVTRVATCRCSQLRATCEGEPVRVSVCHCLECQKRSGSAFAAQARWADEHITVTGDAKTWERVADSGHRVTYRFLSDVWIDRDLSDRGLARRDGHTARRFRRP